MIVIQHTYFCFFLYEFSSSSCHIISIFYSYHPIIELCMMHERIGQNDTIIFNIYIRIFFAIPLLLMFFMQDIPYLSSHYCKIMFVHSSLRLSFFVVRIIVNILSKIQKSCSITIEPIDESKFLLMRKRTHEVMNQCVYILYFCQFSFGSMRMKIIIQHLVIAITMMIDLQKLFVCSIFHLIQKTFFFSPSRRPTSRLSEIIEMFVLK